MTVPWKATRLPSADREGDVRKPPGEVEAKVRDPVVRSTTTMSGWPPSGSSGVIESPVLIAIFVTVGRDVGEPCSTTIALENSPSARVPSDTSDSVPERLFAYISASEQ